MKEIQNTKKDVKLTFWGTSHGLPERERYCSCTMIEVGGNIYFVDVGAPLADIMANYNIPYERVKAIFITHSHLDHCAGLPVFIGIEKWHRKDSNTQFYLPDHKLYNGLLPFFTERADVTNNKIIPHLFKEGSVYDDGIISVMAIPTRHLDNIGLPSYAFCIKIKDKSLIFTGDLTDEFDDFPTQATEREHDAVVCELTHFSVERAIPKFNAVKTKHLIFNHVRDDKIECINRNKEKISHDYQIVNDRDVVVI